MKSEDLEKVLARYKKVYGEVPDWAETISEVMPEFLEPWVQIRSSVLTDGALPRKVKELILLGINLVRRYPSGIESHLRGAMNCGATKEEVMETIMTAIVSSAAPALYTGPRALKAELLKRKK